MGDISNRTIALLLLTAILISLVGLHLAIDKLGRSAISSITGAVTGNGTVSLTIQDVVEANFTIGGINWGTGAVDAGLPSCTINSDGENGSSNNCSQNSFNTVTSGFLIKNIGNNNLSLNISCGKTAAELLGGTNPGYRWNATQNESNSCEGGLHAGTFGPTGTNYSDCNTGSIIVCNDTLGGFQFTDSNDEITLHFQLHIPSDGLKGALSDTLTATVFGDT